MICLLAVTANSLHHDIWEFPVKSLSDMHFIHKIILILLFCRSPSIKHFLYTVRGFQKLSQYFLKLGCKKFSSRKHNQDALEIFFGRKRTLAQSNPTRFSDIISTSIYKVTALNNFIYFI